MVRILSLDLVRMNLYYRAQIQLHRHGGLGPEDTEGISNWKFSITREEGWKYCNGLKERTAHYKHHALRIGKSKIEKTATLLFWAYQKNTLRRVNMIKGGTPCTRMLAGLGSALDCFSR